MNSDDVSRWMHEVDQWFVSSVQCCNSQEGRELTVGDRVTYRRNDVADDNLEKRAVYKVEKIEYVGSSISFVEISMYDATDTTIGSQQDNWVRVNVIESPIVRFIDTNVLPLGVLKASACIKANSFIAPSLSKQTLRSVVQNSLLPALEKFGEAARALLPEIAELFAVDPTVMQKDDTAEAKSGDGESHADGTVTRQFSSGGSMPAHIDRVVAKFNTLFSGLSRLAIVMACYVDIASVNAMSVPSSDTTQVLATAESSLLVHDMESDATPVKQRTPSSMKSPAVTTNIEANTTDTPTIADVMERLNIILEEGVIPLVAAHPLPLLVSVAAWAHNMFAVSAVVKSLTVLADVVQRGNSISTEILDQFNERRRQLNETISMQLDRTGSSLVQFYELSMIDNIVRQDWQSHSKYMRDKKFTHGIVVLCTIMRAAIWDLYYVCRQTESERSGPLRAIGSATVNPNSSLGLQLLLNATLTVCRTYMGFTELSPADCAEMSILDSIVRMVQPSRVRTAQWRKDLCYMVYMVLDTLAWIITQDTMLSLNNTDNRAVEGSSDTLLAQLYSCAQKEYNSAAGRVAITALQREALLQSPSYSDQAEIITEILQVLRYTLLGVYIATEPDAQRVLDKLAQTMVQTSPEDANGHPTPSNKASNVWQSLLEVAGSLSVFDTLTDLFTTEITTSEGNPAVHRTQLSPGAAPVHTPVVHLPAAAFCNTVDVVTHCGMHAFHINEQNAAEITLYAQELQVHVAAVAKDGGALNKLTVEKAVVHQRISSVTITRPQCLLRMLTSSEHTSFNAIFMEVNGVPEPSAANGSRKFVVEMLRRRYELNAAVYPALTEVESAAAVRTQKYVDELTALS